MITREFNLYLHAGHSIPLVINVNQYDHGEQWLFTLFNADGTQYVPSSGAIVGIKSDNLGIINSGTVDSQGRVVINETQQMTAAVGKAVFELLIDDQTHGTANFVVLVEPKPGDNADLSESDYSLFQQAIDGTSAAAIAEGVADWMDENLTPTSPVVDASLTVQGAAADAKKTGDEISDLKSAIAQNSGVPTTVKRALDSLLQNVAFKNDDIYTDELTVLHNWATAVNLLSISAVYTQSGTVYDTDSLDSLKADLVVTATFDDGTYTTVTDYALSGDLTEGTSVITVSYGGKATTFNVEVTEKTDFTPLLIIGNFNISNGALKYEVNNMRLVTNPVGVALPLGKRLKISMGGVTKYQYAAQYWNLPADASEYDRMVVQGTAKTIIASGVSWGASVSSGWTYADTEFTSTEDSKQVLGINFKKSSGNFTNDELEEAISAFSITRVTE